jgi:DNA-binding beta-propeller fold protein YncE
LPSLARAVFLALLTALPAAALAETAAAPAPLVLEGKIALGPVGGRIDHLAVDLRRRRLFVAELGNDSVGVVDLAAAQLLRTIAGFNEPQGIGYEPTTDTIYIANAGDGSVRLLRGEDFAPVGRIELGGDADNVRIDPSHRRVLVGYGDGALAIIDPASRTRAGDVPLPGHPEGFQLIDDGTRAAVNLPGAHRIGIADLAGGRLHLVSTGALAANFPMAIDRAAGRVLVAFRGPPMLAAYTIQGGNLADRLPICADADDLFVDAKRRRVYVSCGAGVVDVLQDSGSGYPRLARIPTASGARTSLFVPELDRLYVASRASGGEAAAIWVFRPMP